MDFSKSAKRKTFFNEWEEKNLENAKLGPGYYKVDKNEEFKVNNTTQNTGNPRESFTVFQVSTPNRVRRSTSNPESPMLISAIKEKIDNNKQTEDPSKLKSGFRNIRQKLDLSIKKLEANHTNRDMLKKDNEKLQMKIERLKEELKKYKEELVSTKVNSRKEILELTNKVEQMQKKVKKKNLKKKNDLITSK